MSKSLNFNFQTASKDYILLGIFRAFQRLRFVHFLRTFLGFLSGIFETYYQLTNSRSQVF